MCTGGEGDRGQTGKFSQNLISLEGTKSWRIFHARLRCVDFVLLEMGVFKGLYIQEGNGPTCAELRGIYGIWMNERRKRRKHFGKKINNGDGSRGEESGTWGTSQWWFYLAEGIPLGKDWKIRIVSGRLWNYSAYWSWLQHVLSA